MEIEKYGNNNYVNWSIDDDGRAGEISATIYPT
jgi:hypothetical protein